MMRIARIEGIFIDGGGSRRPLWIFPFLCALFVLFSAAPAAADFRLCNNTGSRVGVAIGYKDSEGWTTEGWWNLAARSCETLVKGQLVKKYQKKQKAGNTTYELTLLINQDTIDLKVNEFYFEKYVNRGNFEEEMNTGSLGFLYKRK